MPIVFAAPTPATSAGYQGGVAQVMQQNTPHFLQAYANIADTLLKHASLAQQAQEASARMGLMASEGEQDRQNRMAMLQQEGQQRLDQMAFGGAMESQQALQRAQLQAQLNQVELSQADQMRMQRLKQAEAEVAQANLTPEEKQDALFQIRTGLDPLQRRQAVAQMNHQQLQDQMLTAQLQKQQRLENEAAQFRAKNLEDRIALIPDPQMMLDASQSLATVLPQWNMMPPQMQRQLAKSVVAARGGMMTAWEKTPGGWEVIGGSKAGQAGEAANQTQAAVNKEVADWRSTYDKVRSSVDKEVQRRSGDVQNPQQYSQQDIAQMIAGGMAERGFAPNFDAHMQQLAQKYGARAKLPQQANPAAPTSSMSAEGKAVLGQHAESAVQSLGQDLQTHAPYLQGPEQQSAAAALSRAQQILADARAKGGATPEDRAAFDHEEAVYQQWMRIAKQRKAEADKKKEQADQYRNFQYVPSGG